MTFSEAKTKLADYLHRNDLTAPTTGKLSVTDLLNISMRTLERGLSYVDGGVPKRIDNWNCMLNRTSASLAADSITIPTRYKASASLFVNDGSKSYRLRKTDYGDMIARNPYGSTVKGTSTHFAQVPGGTTFLLRPYPTTSVTWTYEHSYYAYTADMSAEGDSNFWTTDGWDALFFGAMMEAEAFRVKDARIDTWRAARDRAIASLARAEKEARYGGTLLNIGQ